MTNFNLEASTNQYLNSLRSQASQYRAAAEATDSRPIAAAGVNKVAWFARKFAPSALLASLRSKARAAATSPAPPQRA